MATSGGADHASTPRLPHEFPRRILLAVLGAGSAGAHADLVRPGRLPCRRHAAVRPDRDPGRDDHAGPGAGAACASPSRGRALQPLLRRLSARRAHDYVRRPIVHRRRARGDARWRTSPTQATTPRSPRRSSASCSAVRPTRARPSTRRWPAGAGRWVSISATPCRSTVGPQDRLSHVLVDPRFAGARCVPLPATGARQRRNPGPAREHRRTPASR